MRTALVCALFLVGCDFTMPEGEGGTGGGGGSTSEMKQLRFTSLSGEYAGTMTSHQSPTWTDRVQNRVTLSIDAVSSRPFDGGPLNLTFTGPSISLRSIVVAGQRRVEDNDPADACALLSEPITEVPFLFTWVTVGDEVTVTLDVFPAVPFSCGYAAYRMTPPVMPKATTTMAALKSGSPVSLHFMGGSTYTHGTNGMNTEALTWDFTLVVQTGP